MTCIVGLVDDGRVWMGGDSAGVAGWDLTVRADRKVFRNGPYVMGFTSSFRMGQLLRHGFEPPSPPEQPGDLEAFMATTFIDAVRERLKAGGWAVKNLEQEQGGTFLVGVSGRLFEIGSDYQVGYRRRPRPSAAVSSIRAAHDVREGPVGQKRAGPSNPIRLEGPINAASDLHARAIARGRSCRSSVCCARRRSVRQPGLRPRVPRQDS